MQIQEKMSTDREVSSHMNRGKITFIPLDNFRWKPGKGQIHSHEYLSLAGILQNKIKLITTDEYPCDSSLVNAFPKLQHGFPIFTIRLIYEKFREILDQKCQVH